MHPSDADVFAEAARFRSAERKRLTVHLDSYTAEALETLTAAAGVTRAEVLREAVANYLARSRRPLTRADVLSIKEMNYARSIEEGIDPRRHSESRLISDGDRGSRLLVEGAARSVTLCTSALVIPRRKVETGTLIRTVSLVWHELALQLSKNWARAFEIPPESLEELVAGAFKKDGFDEVILTPRSGDYGRDIIALKRGIGSIKILGSVKRYAAGRKVRYDDVRALAGVIHGDQSSSKGMLITTSDFPTRIAEDPYIRPLLPTRLELVNGGELQAWINRLLAGARVGKE